MGYLLHLFHFGDGFFNDKIRIIMKIVAYLFPRVIQKSILYIGTADTLYEKLNSLKKKEYMCPTFAFWKRFIYKLCLYNISLERDYRYKEGRVFPS